MHVSLLKFELNVAWHVWKHTWCYITVNS
jgi:hypothetical protein